MAHDVLLPLHIAAGSVGLVLGPLAIWAERGPEHASRAGIAYHWAVLAVAVTAVGLAALDPASLWWLVPLAVLAYALALLGVVAPRRRGQAWVRAYVHGQGGSYIALVTALLVVSLDGAAMVAAWALPTVVGVWLIERRATRIGATDPSSAAIDRPGFHGSRS